MTSFFTNKCYAIPCILIGITKTNATVIKYIMEFQLLELNVIKVFTEILFHYVLRLYGK